MIELRATPSVAVLMTCFNRREHTLHCLRQLATQVGGGDTFRLTVILVDDGSTDGTAEAVASAHPEVEVLRGDGNLFWNRGMHRAFGHALARGFEYYLWLNDDTVLLPDALARLLATATRLALEDRPGIVTGSTYDTVSGERSYGGFRWNGGWRRRLVPVTPDREQPLPCDTMNGNCTLIPGFVPRQIGNLDAVFQHSFGDLDYGFRARAAGLRVYVAPGFAGTCSDNPQRGTWRDQNAGFRRRWRHLNSAKGSPFGEWRHYCRRHLGFLWPLYTVSPYLKTLVTAFRGSTLAARPR